LIWIVPAKTEPPAANGCPASWVESATRPGLVAAPSLVPHPGDYDDRVLSLYHNRAAGEVVGSMRAIVVVLALALAGAASAAERLSGRAHVLDGDTIAVGGVTVRLQGVAAPELDHPNLGIKQEPGGPESLPETPTP
jgi:hypothetical protein